MEGGDNRHHRPKGKNYNREGKASRDINVFRMPTTLGQRYPVYWGGYPPHMSPEDLVLWKTYRQNIETGAVSLYFDVGLGGQTDIPPGTSPEMAIMWLRNTQKRIDVLIETSQDWIITELRHNATSSAVGRLLQYRELWNEDPPDSKPVRLRLVTDMGDSDLQKLCERVGIEYIKI